MRVLITTVPFGEIDHSPLDLLEQAGVDYVINPLGRKLLEAELAEMITDFDVVIAGTEPITAEVMARAPHLQFISRVGIGLDSVDLLEARRKNITVSYTPDAPAPAVSELTMGLMITLLRHVHQADRHMRNGQWQRFMGRRVAELTVGLLGVGRIGKGVIRLLQPYGARILANDLQPDRDFGQSHGVEWTEKGYIYKMADIISLHLPLTQQTKDLITIREMTLMKSDAILINTSRGGIVNENDLCHVLQSSGLGGAAIDVFEMEPYKGPLVGEHRCLLTSHMGSMSQDCRANMELEATKEAIRYIQGRPLESTVPESEYEVQRLFG